LNLVRLCSFQAKTGMQKRANKSFERLKFSPTKDRMTRYALSRMLYAGYTLMIYKYPVKLLCCWTLFGISASIAPATAQMTGDETIGTQVNGSIAAPCIGNCTITNGATRGNNLFHSFQRFSLPNGDIANFQISPTIQNVIVRVTGVGQPFISNLNGTIQTSNPANFFLLNPNGILFGPRATLNIGGSFLATTADRMQFADGTQFRTTDPMPLLSINVPTGLQFNNNPGTIQMQRSVLAVEKGDNFSDFVLVGGGLILDQSIISAPGQWVTLGAVGENGFVQLQMRGDSRSGRLLQRLSLGLDTDTPRRNITLTNQSFIQSFASGGGGGLEVMGRNINLDQSFIGTGILPGVDNALTNQSGDVSIHATANLRLTQSAGIGSSVIPNAIGQGGNISVIASNIQAFEGASITASTQGNGNAGNVSVTANQIVLDGSSPNGASGISSFAVGSSVNGSGGNVQVKTGLLSMTNGAVVSASTFGTGNGGNVQITANKIMVNGTTSDGEFATGIVSQVAPMAIGSGGNVTIETDSLTVSNGGTVSASTFGNGKAGTVRVKANTIDVEGGASQGQFISTIASQVLTGKGDGGEVVLDVTSLRITGGATVSASTNSTGDAGNVKIKAEQIVIDGTTPNGQFGSAISSAVRSKGIGNGGDIFIETDSLSIMNSAGITSRSLGKGSAGNLAITARDLQLDEGGSISAIAVSGNGADIKLTVGQRLEMRRGSQISTSAGLAGAGGDGGNITIDARNAFLVTAPNENNDITANAFNGSGGRVTIETQGIYGFTVRSRAELAALLNTNDPNKLDPSLLPSNDITAISQGNPILNGSVNINVLNLDPSRGLLTLPIDRIDPSQQIAQACQPSGKQARGSFVMVGQGGLPPNPIGVLSSETLITRLSGESIGQPVMGLSKESLQATPNSVTEINRWIIDANGNVQLVAIVPGVESRGFSRGGCL
jgi:filamentous hemagglutinin family protein